MNILISFRLRLKDISAAAVREIIAVTVILCLSVVLSIPSYKQDMEEYRKQKMEMGNPEVQVADRMLNNGTADDTRDQTMDQTKDDARD